MTVTELETYAEKTLGTLLLLGLQTVNVEDSSCDQVNNFIRLFVIHFLGGEKYG